MADNIKTLFQIAPMPATLTSAITHKEPKLKIQQLRSRRRPRPFSNLQQAPKAKQPNSVEVSKSQEAEVKTFGFFKFSKEGVTGALGSQVKNEISAKLISMREGSEAIGVELEMETVGYVAMYDGDSTIAYRYDPESDPCSPHLVGALLDQRVPMGNLLKQLINITV